MSTMTENRQGWRAAAETVAAVADPVTSARLDGRVAEHITDAFERGDHGWSRSWWQSNGLDIALDVADDHDLDDDIATWLTAAAMLLCIATDTRLNIDTVHAVAAAAARQHLTTQENSCPATPPATTSAPPSTSPTVEDGSLAPASWSPLARLAASSKHPFSGRTTW